MTALFEPIGDISRRQLIIDTVGDRAEGDLIKYADLAALLDTDDRTLMQQAVNAAKPGMECAHRKAVVAVRNVGYRIVHASEHLGLARTHQQKSLRQLRRSRSKVDNVDFGKLTDGERAAVTLAATAIGLQLDYMRRNDIRSSRIEKTVETVQSTQERSVSEIAELKRRLARLESATP